MRAFAIAACLLSMAAGFAAADTVQPAAPVDRPLPDYPAAAGTVEGRVDVRFKIGADGHVRDAVVVDSQPKALFDQAALDAVSRWVFKPRTVNGVAVEQLSTIRLRFKPEAAPPQPALLYSPLPSYPPDAFEAKVEGTVKVGFEVLPDGATTNVRAVESSFPGMFDKAAVENVQKWLFSPRPEGSAEAALPMSATVSFKLDQARVSPKPVHKVPPLYPAGAQGAVGSCTIDFTVEPDGSVGDPKIEICYPRGVFEATTLKAIKDWTFEPGRGPSGSIAMPARFTISYRIAGVNERMLHYLKPGQWIALKYTLGLDGRAKDIEVSGVSDPDVSTSEAIYQLKNTQFSPIVENGKPVEKPDQQIRIVGK